MTSSIDVSSPLIMSPPPTLSCNDGASDDGALYDGASDNGTSNNDTHSTNPPLKASLLLAPPLTAPWTIHLHEASYSGALLNIALQCTVVGGSAALMPWLCCAGCATSPLLSKCRGSWDADSCPWPLCFCESAIFAMGNSELWGYYCAGD